MEFEFGVPSKPAVVEKIIATNKRVYMQFRCIHEKSLTSTVLSIKDNAEFCGKLLKLEKGDVLYVDSDFPNKIYDCKKLPLWKRFLNRSFKKSFH